MSNLDQSRWTTAARDTFSKASRSWISASLVTWFSTIGPNLGARARTTTVGLWSPSQPVDIGTITFQCICIENIANWFPAKISTSILKFKKNCVISFKLANLNTGMIKWIWMKYFMTRGKAWSLQNCAFFMGLSARARMFTIILNQNLNRLIKNWIELTGGTMHWGLTRWG